MILIIITNELLLELQKYLLIVISEQGCEDRYYGVGRKKTPMLCQGRI